jgi:hypothetical protein
MAVIGADRGGRAMGSGGFGRLCPDTPISLVGYSLGALLIDNLLSSQGAERNAINAVELYGDPCWYNPDGGFRGLARYAATAGFRLGCFPANAYPYPDFLADHAFQQTGGGG